MQLSIICNPWRVYFVCDSIGISFLEVIVSNNKKRAGCGSLIGGIILLACLGAFFASCFPNSNDKNGDADTNKEMTEKVFSNLSAMKEEELRENFIEACNQIGMDIDQIKDMEQVDDWTSGPRYSFSYMGVGFRTYIYMDNTVKTIKLGANTDIYSKGYEPYQVSDYIVDQNTAYSLMTQSEKYVKEALAFPATAEFPLFDWSIGRMKNYYTLSSTVTAQNAFGVEIELPFTINYEVDGDAVRILYFMLDGDVLSDSMDSVVTPERKRIDDSSDDDSNLTEATLAETDLPLIKTVYAVGTVNIRSGPGTIYDVVRTVPSDTVLNVIAITENNWYRLDDNTCVSPTVVTDQIPASITEKATKEETITLVAGELGDYGRIITIEGEDYIDFYVPEGTYKIINNGIWCKVYVAEDEYYKNTSGYITNDIVDTLEFTENGEQKTVVIGKGEHIELTLDASVTLISEG